MYQLLIPELVTLKHQHTFDPTHGYSYEQLKEVGFPPAFPEFSKFWENTYQENLKLPLNIRLEDTGKIYENMKVSKMFYHSWGGFTTGAWVLEPLNEEVRAGLVVGHGYGGRDGYANSFIPKNTAIILPVARGFHISAAEGYPGESSKHVIFNIEDKNEYSLRGCVAELWTAFSCLYELFPKITTCGFAGASFGGGLGALMAPFEKRLSRVHLSVPTFGNHPIRLQIKSTGSGESVRIYSALSPNVVNNVLPFYDAATAASLIEIPALITPALFDPAVPPPGQFSVANAIPSEKEVWVFQTGHFDSKISGQEDRLVNTKLKSFFELEL
jgi:cephalosporin-C deacetylase